MLLLIFSNMDSESSWKIADKYLDDMQALAQVMCQSQGVVVYSK